jgi:Ca2+-binding RTX toxin-like protein
VLQNGQTISYFSVDEVGNTSATKTSVAARVDTAAPSVSDDVPAAWVASNVTVTLTATDPDSGVDETRYEIDGTPSGSSPVYDPASRPVLQNGQTISYFSVDEVGNTSATKTSVALKVVPAPAVLCSGQPATIVAVPGRVTTGTSGRDVIVGTAGADTINAGGGDDLVCAGGGDDIVDGNNGNDRLRGQGGVDTLDGDFGADSLSGGDDADVLTGGVGDDQIAGRQGNDRLAGEAGDDNLSGGAGNDSLDGGRGHDMLFGGPGHDRLVGRTSADTVNARDHKH